MFLAVVGQVDGDRLDNFLAFIFDDVGAVAEAVAYGELVPVGGHMWCDGQLVAFLVESQDILDAGLVSP